LIYREIARGLRDATPNSYAKKFDIKIEAEKYIKDLKFQIVQKTQNTNDHFKGVKRKRPENLYNSISSVKDHIKKVFSTFILIPILVKNVTMFWLFL